MSDANTEEEGEQCSFCTAQADAPAAKHEYPDCPRSICPECSASAADEHQESCSKYVCRDCGAAGGEDHSFPDCPKSECPDCGTSPDGEHEESCPQFTCPDCGVGKDEDHSFPDCPKSECPDCGTSPDGEHEESCPQYACPDCGAAKDEDHRYPGCPKSECPQCGEPAGSDHKEECPRFACTECGRTGGKHEDGCSKKPPECPDCGALEGEAHSFPDCPKSTCPDCEQPPTEEHDEDCPRYKCPECEQTGGKHAEDCSKKSAEEAIDDALDSTVGEAGRALNTAGAAVQSAVGKVNDVLSHFDRFDGITTSSFIFLIDFKPIGAFQSLSGMEVRVEEYQIPVGGQNHSVVKRPGRMTWSNLVLRRGIASMDVLFEWVNFVSGKGFAAKPSLATKGRSMGLAGAAGKNKYDAQTGALVLTNRFGVPLRSWWIYEALPVRWTGPDFNAAAIGSGETIPMEELEIAHEGLEKIEPF